MNKILFIVDAQNDFMPGGNLAVNKGDEIIPIINALLRRQEWDDIFISKDWHPANHTSFAVNHNVKPFEKIDGEIKWPVHCVMGEKGASIHPDIVIPLDKASKVKVVYKGNIQNKEEYSAGNIQGIEGNEVVVVGLAFDFCVGFTALDLVKNGARVIVVKSGTKAVSEDGEKQMTEKLKLAGVEITE